MTPPRADGAPFVWLGYNSVDLRCLAWFYFLNERIIRLLLFYSTFREDGFTDLRNLDLQNFEWETSPVEKGAKSLPAKKYLNMFLSRCCKSQLLIKILLKLGKCPEGEKHIFCHLHFFGEKIIFDEKWANRKKPILNFISVQDLEKKINLKWENFRWSTLRSIDDKDERVSCCC